jgi:hypothetical protein
MTLGPGGWQGIPNSGYRRHEQFAGNDFVAQLTFLNTQKVPTQPTTIQYRVDSLTSAQPVVGWASVTPTGTEQELQISGSVMVPTRQWYGREVFQIWVQAVIPDASTPNGSITVNQRIIVELIAISVPC